MKVATIAESRTARLDLRLSPREREALDALAALRATTRTRVVADLLMAAAPVRSPVVQPGSQPAQVSGDRDLVATAR